MSRHTPQRITRTFTVVRTGTVPVEMRNLVNLESLYLFSNSLQKPSGCPKDSNGDMCYSDKAKVAAFLRCLGKKSQACLLQ